MDGILKGEYTFVTNSGSWNITLTIYSLKIPFKINLLVRTIYCYTCVKFIYENSTMIVSWIRKFYNPTVRIKKKKMLETVSIHEHNFKKLLWHSSPFQTNPRCDEINFHNTLARYSIVRKRNHQDERVRSSSREIAIKAIG